MLKIYEEAVTRAALLGQSIPGFNPLKMFSFSDYPSIKHRLNELSNWLYGEVYGVIISGIEAQWTLSNNKNNELAKVVLGSKLGKIPKSFERRYFSNNFAARDAFILRKENGLSISDRVWRYTGQFKGEVEMALDIGLRNGLSASEIASDLKKYLHNPDMLFRRVRDQHGVLKLSKRAKMHHPGRGVYRSSYKNARRLAATEINIAYRSADYYRWQQFDFVVGIEIKLSNNHSLNGHKLVDICDELKGKYPKDFKFTGWHPLCRCFAVSILKTPDEMAQDNDRIMEGKKPLADSKNKIASPPAGYLDWLKKNKVRMAEKVPYFLRGK